MPHRNILAALAILAAVTTAPERAAANRVDAALPPQGLYEGCSPGAEIEACIGHLATIRAAGFRYVLNYSAWYGSPAQVLEYADAASALGLKLIWPLNHSAWRGLGSLSATYTTFNVAGDPGRGASTRDVVSNTDFIARAIGLVANHPGTWGFYIGDELLRGEAALVAALSATVRALAPDRPQLYIARPGAALLMPFVHIADVAGADVYPIGSSDPPVGKAARSTRAVTLAAGTESAMVLQVFSWSQYRSGAAPRYPSRRVLQAMRDAAIEQANPAMILWYSYQDILRSDDPDHHWCDLTRAAFSGQRDPFASRC